MSDLVKKFADGLELSPEMVKSLDIVRDNKELKIFALSLPTLKYPDSYLLAGRIFMYVNIKNCPIDIKEYVTIADGILRREIKDFMLGHAREIDQLLEDTYFKNFENYNILSASSCVNYLLKISHEENPIETPCQMFLRQAIQFYYQDSWEEVKQCYYELINQDYVHASPTMFNAGTRKNQMSSCFKAGTKIFTYNRGIINIEDVQIGDEVKTHKGNIKKVSQLHKNLLGDRNLYNVKLNRTFEFEVTDNHRFWAIQSKGENKPKWVPMEYLCQGDFIALPPADENSKTYNVDMMEGIESHHKYEIKDNWLKINTEYTTPDHLNGTDNLITRQKSNSPIKKEWQADKNWAFFVGAWFGDGNIINKTRNEKKKVHGIRFVAHKSNYQIIERLIKIGKDKTGIEAKVNKGTNKNNDLYYLDFHSVALGNYFNINYGSGFDNKKLDQRMYYWGGQEIKSFMTGLFSTDGCWTEKNKLLIQLSNVNLMKNIFYLLRANGVYARYNFVDKSRNKLATTDSALIELPFEYLQKDEISKHYDDNRMSSKKDMKCSTRRKIIDNQTFIRLDSKKLSLDRPKHVYTIGVDDDHSYCIEGIMAENCFLLSLGDNLESLLYSGAGDVGLISKLQGGIGLSMNAIRHSNISNTGKSSGVLPFAKIYDATITCVNQGGKRNGAMTITLIDWHIDFMDFIQARDNYTHNGIRFKQANTCAYLSRLFMERVKNDQDWTFFCPAKAKVDGHSLLGSHGHKFEEIYEKVEKAAIDKKIEFDKLDQEIKEMEKNVNKEGAERKIILEYHAKTIDRIKMRKHLIDYKVMKARDVYNKLCDMNVKSSMPYIVYRDPVNEKNNMANIGTTESLNLCLEISEPSTPDSIASCNLGHLNLKAYVKKLDKKITLTNLKDFYDFEAMGKATQSLTRNINKVIDYNYYPLDERDENGKVIKRGKISTPNFANRPIGIGVSGLAEVFAYLDIAYDSPEAFQLNKMIFAAMYYHALYQSRLLALKDGEYSSFRTGECEAFMDGKWQKIKGSPLSNGFFQFDLWQQEADYLKSMNRINTKIYNEEDNEPINPIDWGMDIEKHSWSQLRKDIVQDGVRNSMLIALMPTASSAQLLRNAETTEAHQTLIYSRKLVHGNFTAFSEPFVDAMSKANLWNKETIDFIMMSNGSIEKLDHFVADNQSIFPANFYNDGKIRAAKLTELQHLKRIHRGMYEISQKDTMQMARQRGIYVCQSQSLNIYLPEPDVKKMKAVHSYSNALGLKTGMYYLRANPASQTERFTVDISIQEYHKKLKNKKNNVICTDEVCIMCE